MNYKVLPFLFLISFSIPSSLAATTITDSQITTPALTITGSSSFGTGVFSSTTQFLSGICSGYTLCVWNNGLGFFEINATSNTILVSDSVNASNPIQDALLNLNKTKQTYSSNSNNTYNGGSLRIAAGVYPITHEITIPVNGNITVTGDGMGTILKVPTGHTNNIFAYRNNSTTGFSYTFKNMFVKGSGFSVACQPCSGFYFQSTQGPKDVLWDNVWATNFGNNGFFFKTIWNYNLDHTVCEFSASYCIFAAGGVDLKIENSKCLDNSGNACALIESQVVTLDSTFWQGNQKRGLWIANPASNVIVSNSHFYQNSQSSNNGFADLDLSTVVNNIIIDQNEFAGNNASPRPSFAINLGSGSHDISVTDNDFIGTPTYIYATPSIITSGQGQANMTLVNNMHYNPVNKLTNWNDNNVYVSPFGANGTVKSGNTYTINYAPVFAKCTGATSETIKDQLGNTIYTNTTYTGDLAIGFSITNAGGTPVCSFYGE